MARYLITEITRSQFSFNRSTYHYRSTCKSFVWRQWLIGSRQYRIIGSRHYLFIVSSGDRVIENRTKITQWLDGSMTQFFQQCLRLLQVFRVEPLGEPESGQQASRIGRSSLLPVPRCLFPCLLQQEFPFDPIQLRLVVPLPILVHHSQRLSHHAQSFLSLPPFRIHFG